MVNEQKNKTPVTTRSLIPAKQTLPAQLTKLYGHNSTNYRFSQSQQLYA